MASNALIKMIIIGRTKNKQTKLQSVPGKVMSLRGKAEDSPGPDPAPEPELLPSDLSSDWPTGGEGMVNMTVNGGEGKLRH